VSAWLAIPSKNFLLSFIAGQNWEGDVPLDYVIEDQVDRIQNDESIQPYSDSNSWPMPVEDFDMDSSDQQPLLDQPDYNRLKYKWYP
jgi:hypothetical protein